MFQLLAEEREQILLALPESGVGFARLAFLEVLGRQFDELLELLQFFFVLFPLFLQTFEQFLWFCLGAESGGKVSASGTGLSAST